jgi:magnesium transporter
MLHIRALIKPDCIIVFDSAGSTESEISRKFKWHLERNIKAGIAAREECEVETEEEIGLVYEHRALESILVATSNALEEEMGYTRNLVRDLLADLEDDINRDNLKRLLHYSRRMAGFQSRARYVKRAVDEVLESGKLSAASHSSD